MIIHSNIFDERSIIKHFFPPRTHAQYNINLETLRIIIMIHFFSLPFANDIIILYIGYTRSIHVYKSNERVIYDSSIMIIIF